MPCQTISDKRFQRLKSKDEWKIRSRMCNIQPAPLLQRCCWLSCQKRKGKIRKMFQATSPAIHQSFHQSRVWRLHALHLLAQEEARHKCHDPEHYWQLLPRRLSVRRSFASTPLAELVGWKPGEPAQQPALLVATL